MEKLHFASDYMEGALPQVLEALISTNDLSTPGYGDDEFSDSARKKILDACGMQDGEVWFLEGGTQANATVIDCLLNPCEGVVACDTGHVFVHEAGAIEASGHKVLTIKGKDGKLCAIDLKKYMEFFFKDQNHTHMVQPGMVYLSQPTEYGTLYSRQELSDIQAVCREYSLPLYIDGARLAYALAAPENDVSLKDLPQLCDIFYIGGTKCGTLFGEAVVLTRKNMIPHCITRIKQHGALLAKGRVLGVQFDALFTDHLYEKCGKPAIESARRIREALKEKGFELSPYSPTNQVFFLIDNERMKKLGEKVEYGFMDSVDENHSRIRFATAWSSTKEKTDALIEVIRAL